MERTFAIVKPDAVRRGLTGDILKRIEASGLTIVALGKIHLSRADAEKFYDVHKARPFFRGLCDYMTSGPVVVAVLAGRGCDQQVASADGRNRSQKSRRRHDSQGLRNRHRTECHSRLGCARDGRSGNCLLFPRSRDFGMKEPSCFHGDVSIRIDGRERECQTSAEPAPRARISAT